VPASVFFFELWSLRKVRRRHSRGRILFEDSLEKRRQRVVGSLTIALWYVAPVGLDERAVICEKY